MYLVDPVLYNGAIAERTVRKWLTKVEDGISHLEDALCFG